MDKLLTRSEFRNAVFARDKNQCVLCYAPAQDAHHIFERRLWPDGGYYLNNGASVCGPCHLKCESTEITVETLWLKIGVDHKKAPRPPHLYPDQKYDKWGNPYNDKGLRFKGDLFYDESVQKILKPYLSEFCDYVKYPRTYHLPTSPGRTKDDRVLENTNVFAGKKVIITEKMDGENTTIYQDHVHARSINSDNHPSRSWVKNLASKLGWLLDDGWRICGENMWAKHSIHYTDLEDYFLGFSMWHNNKCLSWRNTTEWFELLGVKSVPVLYEGVFHDDLIGYFANLTTNKENREGFVIRLADSFLYGQFRHCVAKYVRENHVQTSHNWKREKIVRNKLK